MVFFLFWGFLYEPIHVLFLQSWIQIKQWANSWKVSLYQNKESYIYQLCIIYLSQLWPLFKPYFYHCSIPKLSFIAIIVIPHRLAQFQLGTSECHGLAAQCIFIGCEFKGSYIDEQFVYGALARIRFYLVYLLLKSFCLEMIFSEFGSHSAPLLKTRVRN